MFNTLFSILNFHLHIQNEVPVSLFYLQFRQLQKAGSHQLSESFGSLLELEISLALQKRWYVTRGESH